MMLVEAVVAKLRVQPRNLHTYEPQLGEYHPNTSEKFYRLSQSVRSKYDWPK
jgi:hypothetical protein